MSFQYPISGGKAEKAKKTPSDFNPKAIKKGIKVEKEHTPDPRIATGITIDHLTENKEYYDYLDEMEKKMKKASWDGFFDELEKIAAGPKIVHHDLSYQGKAGGGFIPRKEYDSLISGAPGTNPHGVDIEAFKKFRLKPGQDLVVLPTYEGLANQLASQTKGNLSAARVGALRLMPYVRRHEMTHWMRHKKGLLPEMTPSGPKPGISNLLRLGREEVAANASSLKAFKGKPLAQTIMGALTPMNVVNSIRGAYPTGVLKNTVGASVQNAGTYLKGLAKGALKRL